MRLLRTASHHVAHLAYQKVQLYYQMHANNLETTQRRTLERILKQHVCYGLDYENFIQTYPVTGYIPSGHFPENFDFSHQHEAQEKPLSWQHSLKRSSHWGLQALKTCRQPKSVFKHVDHAMALWMDELYQQYPSLKQSSHYWMLPPSMLKKHRQEPLWFKDVKKLLARFTHAVPHEVTCLKSFEDMLYATAVYLVANKSLGLIAVKNANLVTELLDTIEQYQADIVKTLRTGDWGRLSLVNIKAPRACEQSYKLERLDLRYKSAWKELWPELKVVAVWEYSGTWMEQFKQRIHVALYTQALNDLPAKITVPFGQYQLLNYHNYFFEFLNLKTQKIVTAWQLKTGDIVRPIVTAGLGCIRCLMNIDLKITAFYQQIPCFSSVQYVTNILEDENKLGIREKIQDLTLGQLHQLIKF